MRKNYIYLFQAHFCSIFVFFIYLFKIFPPLNDIFQSPLQGTHLQKGFFIRDTDTVDVEDVDEEDQGKLGKGDQAQHGRKEQAHPANGLAENKDY